MRAADLVSIAVSIAIVAASYLFWRGAADSAAMVRIQTGSEVLAPVALDVPRTISVTGPLGTTLIEVGGGRARIAASPCRDQRCVLAGWIERSGAAVVCLPNRVSLDLTGTPSGYDALSF
jgi:hypothetical protein